jgi:uncharacterized membrane protein
MKARLPEPTRYSIELHRRQTVRQIILPVVIAALALIGMVVLIVSTAFGRGGEVGRWAAISTIWILLPVLLAGLAALAILIGLIYLLARALGLLPHYTGLAQEYTYKASGYIRRGADLAVKPILVLGGIVEDFKAFIGRITS